MEQYPIYWEFHLTQDSLVIFKLIVFEKKNLAKRKKRFQKIIDIGCRIIDQYTGKHEKKQRGQRPRKTSHIAIDRKYQQYQ